MSVLYYEAWTPATYCPSGFQHVDSDLIPSKLFKGPSQLHDFGSAASPYHFIQMSLERRQDDNYEDSIKDLTVDPSQPLKIGLPSQQLPEMPKLESAPSTCIDSPLPHKSSPGVKEITQNTEALTFETPHLVQPRLLPPASQAPPAMQAAPTITTAKVEEDSVSGNIRCFCDDAYVVSNIFFRYVE